MALNRFSVLPKATIVNTQVLPDLGIIDSALTRQQQSYDATAEQIQQGKQQAANLKGYGDKDNEYLNKINEDMKGFVGGISNQDLGSQQVKGQWNEFLGNVAADPELKKIQKVASIKAQEEEAAQELGAKGKLHDNQLRLHNLQWQKYSQTGDINDMPSDPLYEAVNLVEERGKLVNMIKSSGHEGTAFFDNFAYGKSSSGVSPDTISKAVREQLGTYANSQAGKQEANDYKALVLDGSIDPKKTSFEKYLLQEVLSTANNYSYSNSSNNYASAYNESKKKKEEDAYVGEGYAPVSNGKDIEIDSDGNVNVNGFLDLLQMVVPGYEPRDAAELELQGRLKKISKHTGVPIKQVAEQLNKDPNVSVRYFNSKKSQEISTRIFNPKTGGGELYTRKVYDPEKYPEGISLKEYMDEEGITETELKGGITVIGDIAPDNPYTPKGYATMINGKSLFIDDSYSMKSSVDDIVATQTHNIAKVLYNGGKPVTFTNVNPKDGKLYEYTYGYDAKTDKPKQIKVEPVK